MINRLIFKKRTWFNTTGIKILQVIGCIVGFLLLMLLWLSQANGAEMELSAGRTNYNVSDNGTWWQKGLDHHFTNEENSLAIGVTDYLTDNTRYHLGYTHLGNMSSWAVATTDADFSGSGCFKTPCEKTDVFIGNGYVNGIYVTIAPGIVYGKWKFFIEGGLWVYQASFHMTVVNNINGINKVGWDREKDDALQIGLIAGVGVEYNTLQAVLTGYKVDSAGEAGDTIPNYQGYAVNFSLRKLF